MQPYLRGTATPGCAFPKPVKVKRAVIKKENRKPAGSNEQHEELLAECINILQTSYPELGFLHIPNTLYSLIGGLPQEGGLWWALEKALGYSRALRIKQELADAFKNVPDIVVFSEDGRYMAGEIKTGNATPTRGQERWVKTRDLKVWNNTNKFLEDLYFFTNGVKYGGRKSN